MFAAWRLLPGSAIFGILRLMSKAEIISAIPSLTHAERREVVRAIFEMEQEAEILAECDRLALERFQTMDAREAEDEKNAAR